MEIRIPIGKVNVPGFVANFARHTLEGMARGYAPLFWSLGLPPLYESGIRFAYDAEHGSGIERFWLPHEVLQRGHGDCNDLVCYRLSELYVAGHPATCRAEWQGANIHVLVRLANGVLEDPSILLGAQPG